MAGSIKQQQNIGEDVSISNYWNENLFHFPYSSHSNYMNYMNNFSLIALAIVQSDISGALRTIHICITWINFVLCSLVFHNFHYCWLASLLLNFNLLYIYEHSDKCLNSLDKISIYLAHVKHLWSYILYKIKNSKYLNKTFIWNCFYFAFRTNRSNCYKWTFY